MTASLFIETRIIIAIGFISHNNVASFIKMFFCLSQCVHESYFAERVRHIVDVKINHLRTAIRKSDNLPNIDMFMIRIQALVWVQGRIQDIILENVTRDWPFYDNDK